MNWKMGLIALLSLFLVSCGFHPRRAECLPPELHLVYVEIPNPYSSFAVKLKNLLRSMSIQVTTCPTDTPTHLLITNVAYSHSYPNVIAANYATTYTFTLTLKIELAIGNRIVSGPRAFSVSGNMTLNPNQVLVPGSDTVIREELQRQIISLIYYWLLACHP